MTTYTTPLPKVLEIYLELANYPIRADRIRERMREELFARGIISRDIFEKEVEEKAIQSQRREGLLDPYLEEPSEIWEKRKRLIRDHLTDFYFAYNLPHRLLEEIIRSEVGHRADRADLGLTFNPELAPWDLLFAKGLQYEALPPEQRAQVQHHLKEIIVVLIKAMISDNLRFVGVAKEYFTVADLAEIRRRRIGRGKIGGKAAGLMLAWNILQRHAQNNGLDLSEHLAIPESYFIGADVNYEFMELNDLLDCLNQKYKSPEEITADYQTLPQRFARGRFPDKILEELRLLLDKLGPVPLIVRSSSLLEDNFSTSFAGKYESVFCPNQASAEENLQALTHAISQVYASALNPDALLYRQQMGLVDYDERMAVIIQKVEGSAYHDHFFPTVAGVAFSRNPFLWSPRLRREDGFVRMVTGLGTRAVDRVPDDYPRMAGLSHPALRPVQGAEKIRHYSQRYMDVIDLRGNTVRTLPVSKVIDLQYPWIRFLASVNRDGIIESLSPTSRDVRPQDMIMTLDGLLQRTEFVSLMKQVLKTLETAYRCPVDVEFTVELLGKPRKPDVVIHLLQCRPQSNREEGRTIHVPKEVPQQDVLFTATHLVPNGVVPRIRYIVFVDPQQFARLALPSEKLEIARVVGRLNRALAGERFILMGPGRWGSSNLDLGVKVTYSDIFNTRMLIEIGQDQGGGTPEVSYGTHFFQDLVEARIYPLAVLPETPGVVFNRRFLTESPNKLAELLPADAIWDGVVKVIDVPAVCDGKLLEVVMSADENLALAYFKDYEEEALQAEPADFSDEMA